MESNRLRSWFPFSRKAESPQKTDTILLPDRYCILWCGGEGMPLANLFDCDELAGFSPTIEHQDQLSDGEEAIFRFYSWDAVEAARKSNYPYINNEREAVRLYAQSNAVVVCSPVSTSHCVLPPSYDIPAPRAVTRGSRIRVLLTYGPYPDSECRAEWEAKAKQYGAYYVHASNKTQIYECLDVLKAGLCARAGQWPWLQRNKPLWPVQEVRCGYYWRLPNTLLVKISHGHCLDSVEQLLWWIHRDTVPGQGGLTMDDLLRNYGTQYEPYLASTLWLWQHRVWNIAGILRAAYRRDTNCLLSLFPPHVFFEILRFVDLTIAGDCGS